MPSHRQPLALTIMIEKIGKNLWYSYCVENKVAYGEYHNQIALNKAIDAFNKMGYKVVRAEPL